MFLNQEKWESSFSKLPNSTIKFIIKGGNHSGYGNYGHQKGDGEIVITNDIQQNQVAEKIFEVFSR